MLVAVVVLGLSLVVYARGDRQNEDLGGVPQLGDHIHQALGVNVCGEWLTDLPEFESPVGIHTHGDGVLHIHPFSQLGVGANATFSRYLEDARDGGLDVSLSNSKLQYLDETVEEGDTKCDGVDEPELRMAVWDDVQGSDDPPEVTTGDFGELRLTTDGAGITVFYGDSEADIPKPPHAENLAELGAADSGEAPPEEGDSTTTTASGEPSESTTTTASGEPSESTTTTASGEPSESTTTAAP